MYNTVLKYVYVGAVNQVGHTSIFLGSLSELEIAIIKGMIHTKKLFAPSQIGLTNLKNALFPFEPTEHSLHLIQKVDFTDEEPNEELYAHEFFALLTAPDFWAPK